MSKIHPCLTLVFFALLTIPLLAKASAQNIALNRPYMLSEAPNYSAVNTNKQIYTSSDDGKKLTDGVVSAPGIMWVKSTTLGWMNKRPVITIDLGSDQPISGLSFSTAAGLGGVTWPRGIFVFTSVDGVNFYPVTELVTQSSLIQDPPSLTKYSQHIFKTTDLRTHGRYVSIIPDASYLTFVDEIEVLKGNSSFLNLDIRKGVKLTAAELKTFLNTRNIALGKPYQLSQTPNYSAANAEKGVYYTSVDNGKKLTDGVSNKVSTFPYFWLRASTVGWITSRTGPIHAIVDLGSVQSISGASFTTAAGASGVTWPSAVQVLVSNDGISYTEAGEIVSKTPRHLLPDENKYSTFKFTTNTLNAQGRYVAFLFETDHLLFIDELEIYRGMMPLIQSQNPIPTWTNLDEASKNLNLRNLTRARLTNDLDAIEKLIKEKVPTGNSYFNSLLNEAALLRDELRNLPTEVPAKLILPFNPIHEKIFKVQARTWRSLGLNELTVWQGSSHWDLLKLVHLPPVATSSPEVKIVTMNGKEHRSGSFYISNPSDHSVLVNIEVKNLPMSNLRVGKVVWTDTKILVPVNSAIKYLVPTNNSYSISIPAGMTQEVWITLNAQGLAPGSISGSLAISTPSKNFNSSVAVNLKVSEVTFQRPSLHLGGWDYINNAQFNLPSSVFKDKFTSYLKDYFVDMPWEMSTVMPFNTNITNATRNFDDWIAAWKPDSETSGGRIGARKYAIFLNPPQYIHDDEGCASIYANESCGQNNPQRSDIALNENQSFNNKVKKWLTFWVEHAAKKGIKAHQLVIELKDEPNEHKKTDEDIIIAWARAIKKANLGVKVYENPTYEKPNLARTDLLKDVDTVSPYLPMFTTSGSAFRNYFTSQNKDMAFYSCSGPAFLLDPDTYYRHQAWYAAKYNASMIGYWVFFDTRGFTSWREYEEIGTGSFVPFFVDTTNLANPITTSKQMEAIREGMEDFSYLDMLKKLIAAAPQGSSAANNASQVLVSAYSKVLDSNDLPFVIDGKPNQEIYKWNKDKSRKNTDIERVKILEVIEGF